MTDEPTDVQTDELTADDRNDAPVRDMSGAPSEDEVLDCVIVIKRMSEQGQISTEVMPNGKVQPTEVQTLLELGIKAWRQQIGL